MIVFRQFSIACHRQAEHIREESPAEHNVVPSVVGNQARISGDLSQGNILLHPTGHLQRELTLFDIHSSGEKPNFSSFTNELDIGETLMYLYVHWQRAEEQSRSARKRNGNVCVVLSNLGSSTMHAMNGRLVKNTLNLRSHYCKVKPKTKHEILFPADQQCQPVGYQHLCC